MVTWLLNAEKRVVVTQMPIGGRFHHHTGMEAEAASVVVGVGVGEVAAVGNGVICRWHGAGRM